VTLKALHMDPAIPAGSQDLRDTASIIAIRLVAHRSQRCTDLSGLEADHFEPGRLQSIRQILRECAGLKADDLQLRTERAQTGAELARVNPSQRGPVALRSSERARGQQGRA
jgi:hypothetical protein